MPRNEPTVVIERINAGPTNMVLPVIGRVGSLGSAVWDAKRACHCLRLPLSTFQAERRAIVERLGRRDRVSFDFEPADAEPSGDGGAPSEVEMILVDYQLGEESAEQTLLRLISHLTTLQAWTPHKGKKPELEVPRPCSPRAS